MQKWQVKQEGEIKPSVPKRQVKQEVTNAQTRVPSKIQVDWKAFAVIALGIWIGWALYVYWYWGIGFMEERLLFALRFGAGSGLAIGLGMAIGIRSLGFHPNRKQVVSIILAWMVGFGIAFLLLGYLAQDSVDTSDILLMSLLVLILFSFSILPGTLATVAGLSTSQSGFRWNTVWLLCAGWLLGIAIPAIILTQYSHGTSDPNSNVFYLGGGLAGIIVGLWTQWRLRKLMES